MVAPAAIRRAEEECLADAELRERRRVAAAEKREAEEPAYVAAVTEAIRVAYPGCPPSEAEQIAAWTCEKTLRPRGPLGGREGIRSGGAETGRGRAHPT